MNALENSSTHILKIQRYGDGSFGPGDKMEWEEFYPLLKYKEIIEEIQLYVSDRQIDSCELGQESERLGCFVSDTVKLIADSLVIAS